MDWVKPSNAYNIVRDWNKVQGMTHPSDEHAQIRRDINVRKVAIENSSERSISVALMPYYSGPIPNPQFTLQGGQIINLAVNVVDGPMQYVHLLDPITKKVVGKTAPLRTDSNSFVLRDGINMWFVQAFKTYGYRG